MPPSLLVALLIACNGGNGNRKDSGAPGADGPQAWGVVDDLGARATDLTAADDVLYAVVDNEIWSSPDGRSWVAVDMAGLPDGQITFLSAVPGADGTLLAWVHGQGMYRSRTSRWSPVPGPPESALMTSLNPRSAPVPFQLAGTGDGPVWLAAAGGLYRSDDQGETWTTVEALSDVGFNLLFSGVAARGDTVVATAFRPAGVLPSAYSGLLTAGVFISRDGGETWEDGDPDLATRYPADAAVDADGTIWLATQDEGVLRRDDDGWTSVGGPVDALEISAAADGVDVLSGTRGIWRYEGGIWTHAGDGPMAGIAGDHALGLDAALLQREPGLGDTPPASGGATVHVALSMHGNLYHSYRGDTVDDDGFGVDLDVMRTSLSWLAERPEVHADWDFDNHWSTDTWMQEHGADIIEGIAARVDAGTDDVRLMSWNNGAVSAHTRPEFDATISRAWESNEQWFSEVVPGVQPQECMFTPEHIPWYADQGIEWITLFNSATGFTALRPELDLAKAAWTNPSTISYDGASLTLVPVYHHGDLLDHGGLRGWVRKLHQDHTDDQLLVIHFDADAESWEAFGDELDALSDLDFVEYTTIQDYLDTHPPTVDTDLPYDLADGTGDGYQSWAEKDFNHELATTIAQGRRAERAARALAPDDEAVAATLDAGLEDRLLALSTTNFGLSAPDLHPDRVASARAYADGALDAAQSALDLAEAASPVAPGEIVLTNLTEAAGPALVELTVEVPADDWTRAEDVALWDEEGAPMPLAITAVDDTLDPVRVDIRLVVEVEAEGSRALAWGLDEASAVDGAGADPVAWDELPLEAPRTECLGSESTGAVTVSGSPVPPDGRDTVEQALAVYSLPLCDAEGVVSLQLSTWAGLPGVVVEVDASFDESTRREDAESVALTPLICGGGAETVRWRTMGGAVHERPVRQGTGSWNGQVIASWAEVACTDTTTVQISHRVAERTSLAMLPMRTLGADALIAPLGTLWGTAPPHENRETGGHGMADVITEVIGSQYRPAAPDWTGAEVAYTLLLGTDEHPVDEDTMELFAHPPHVRVGAFAD